MLTSAKEKEIPGVPLDAPESYGHLWLHLAHGATARAQPVLRCDEIVNGAWL